MAKTPRIHTIEFKKQIVLELLKGDKTRNEICSQFGIHPTQADNWKRLVLSGMEQLLTHKYDTERLKDKQLIEELYRQIGQLKVELDWLKKKMGYTS
jgi:transposase-like protein